MKLSRECAPPCLLVWKVRRMQGSSPFRPWLIYHGHDLLAGLRRYPGNRRRHGWVMRLASGSSTHATIGDAVGRQNLIGAALS